ncbi:hypothetical protein A0H76_947 [Hepatospora eriocheir]|uniref:Uncharacterized protein n=1 Tax=Hepatospora eriocheir TaxID=1081669 RepID=A0A1X0QHX7_9MICR|nr:hypothetical protein HERIO_1247 [Hepatospora eriocheir]ORD99381.1 hypothetical protein A0H76_947 [Hepatospora eriocheir]
MNNKHYQPKTFTNKKVKIQKENEPFKTKLGTINVETCINRLNSFPDTDNLEKLLKLKEESIEILKNELRK